MERLKALQLEIHDIFIAMVRERRAGKLVENPDLFTGAFWTGGNSVALGLADSIGDMRSVIKQRYGSDAKLKLITPQRGLFGRRLSFFGSQSGGGEDLGFGAARGLAAAVEERALWNRFGL